MLLVIRLVCFAIVDLHQYYVLQYLVYVVLTLLATLVIPATMVSMLVPHMALKKA